MNVQITRSRERLDWDFTRSYQRLELNRKVFHCFDTLKELSSDDLVSFFNEVDTEDKLSLEHIVSFLTSLTQEKELCSDELVSFFKELDTSR